MKIKYKFATETVEIEVPDEWVNILKEEDRLQYNNDHTETRRHESLYAYEEFGDLYPSDADTLGDVLAAESREQLMAAVRKLTPLQQELIDALFFRDIKLIDYAAQRGVSPAAISKQKKVALRTLKKILEAEG